MPGAKNWGAGLLAALLWASLGGCTAVSANLGTIPAPPEDTRLRVFVQPISGPPKARAGRWKTPHADFEAKTLQRVEKILARKGFYEVVGAEEKNRVLGGRDITFWQWTRDDFALVRQAGRALFAEYAMIMERGYLGTSPYWRVVLINVATGRRFAVYARQTQWEGKAEFNRMLKASYRELFRDAKADLLATAVAKGRPRGAATVTGPLPSAETGTAAAGPAEAVGEAALGRKIEADATADAEVPIEGKAQLAVNDLEADERQRTVALILAEVLREELFALGTFTLVSRESMKEALDEIRLGQAGLVDGAQAVQAGRMLAAEQIVLGRLSVLGPSSVLQVKRVDTASQEALGFASLKCPAGHEADLLDAMPQLARRLAGR